MKIPPKTTFQVHSILYKNLQFNCSIHVVNNVKFCIDQQCTMVYKTEASICNIGEVESKSWSNTVIETKRF